MVHSMEGALRSSNRLVVGRMIQESLKGRKRVVEELKNSRGKAMEALENMAFEVGKLDSF